MNWYRVALVAVVTALSNGCGSAASVDAQDDREPEPAVLTMSAGWKLLPEASVSGDLRVEAGCVLVGGYLAVWPAGTTWDATAEAVTFDDAAGTSVGLGEPFRGGGGQLPDRVYEAELAPEDMVAMNRCLAETDALGTLFAYPSG